MIDTSGADASVPAQDANRYQADVFVALAGGVGSGVQCAYFANQRFRSEGGYHLALRLTEALRGILRKTSTSRAEEHIGSCAKRGMAVVVCESSVATTSSRPCC